MAFYNDPSTGKRVDVNEPLARDGSGFSMVSWIVLAALLIAGGTMLYHYYEENERAAQSTIDHPVTSPSDPNAGAVHPAPSPNPGP